jgi:hypothetical protein
MESLSRMIGSHPSVEQADPLVASLVDELTNCASLCAICADACLTEPDVNSLARCVALNDLCADICGVTARTASRVGHQESTVLRRQLEACREVCILCAEECELHQHEHCRVCAAGCRSAQRVCSTALHQMLAMA